jgi:hypothetical protein
MKEELAKLIKKSSSLTEEKKKVYLKMIEFLPEDQLKSLLEILEKEVSAKEEIEKIKKEEKNVLNLAFLTEIEKIYSENFKSAVLEEEKNEKIEAENILKQLKNS